MAESFIEKRRRELGLDGGSKTTATAAPTSFVERRRLELGIDKLSQPQLQTMLPAGKLSVNNSLDTAKAFVDSQITPATRQKVAAEEAQRSQKDKELNRNAYEKWYDENIGGTWIDKALGGLSKADRAVADVKSDVIDTATLGASQGLGKVAIKAIPGGVENLQPVYNDHRNLNDPRNADGSREIPVIGPVLRTLDRVADVTKPAADIAQDFYTPGGGLTAVNTITKGVGGAISKVLPSLERSAIGRGTKTAIQEGIVGSGLGAGHALAHDPEQAASEAVSGAAWGAGLGIAAKALAPAFNRFLQRTKAVTPELEQATREALDNAQAPSQVPDSYKSIQTGTLRNASNDSYLSHIMGTIRDDVYQQMTPPLENPNELAKWIRPHLGEDVSLNEIRKLSYDDLAQLAEDVRSNLSMHDVASRVAKTKGFDLDAAFAGKRPSVRNQVQADMSRRAYGIYDAPQIKPVRSLPREGAVRAPEEPVVPTSAAAAEPAAENVDTLIQQYKAADEALQELDRRYASGATPNPADVQRIMELEQMKAGLFQRVRTIAGQLPDDVQAMRTGAAAAREEVPPAPKPARSAEPEAPAQRMKADPIPFRPANPDANVEPISEREIRKQVQRLFKLPVRTGRIGTSDEDVLGIFKPNAEVIRTRKQGGLQETTHELGHFFDKKYELKSAAHQAELRNLIEEAEAIDASAYSADELLAEGPAEFMRLYLTDPDTARRLAPSYFDHFEETVPASELKKLAKVQDMAARWIDQGEALRFRGKITEDRYDSKSTLKEKAAKFYSATFDKLNQLAVAERAITGSKQLGDATRSLYKRARLVAGAPKKAQMKVEELTKLLNPLEKANIPLRNFRDFALALHARDLERLGYETGFTKGEIDDALAKYDSPVVREVQAALVKFQRGLIDMAVEGQLITKEAAEAMEKKYPNYMPMMREMDEESTSGLISGKGFADLSGLVKARKGSTKNVKDPLESIIKNVYSTIDHIEKNKVGLELARLSTVKGAGRWIEKLSGKEPKQSDPIVNVWENGKKVQYQLDPELYRTVKQLDEDTTNMVVKMLSFPAQILRGGATLAPEFILRNPIRDQFSAFVVSNYGYNPIIDLPKGIFHVIKGKYWKNGDELYKRWVNEGGGYGNTHSVDRSYLREQVKQLKDERSPWARRTMAIASPKQWLRVLQSMSELTEEATKVGEFGKAIRKGATPEEAAFQSRDLMDFARIGNSIKQVNRIDAFLNANLQGKDKLVRAFKKNPVRTTLRAMTSITLPAVGIMLYNDRFGNAKQKATLNEAPQWLRDTFFLVAVPGTDVVARIPKPFDLAPVFANIPENIMRFVKDNDPEEWSKFAKSQAIQMGSIPYMLTALQPIIENMTNYDFFTRGPVVPRRDQDAEPKNQYGNNTSSVAKEIGGLTNYSPYKIDNLISGYTASLGKHATSLTDVILDKTGISTRPPAAAKKFSELPVINSFTVNTTGGGKPLDDFYKALDKAQAKSDSFINHGKGDESAVEEYRALSRVSDAISKVNKERRETQARRDMSRTEKRNYLDELDQYLKELGKEGLAISKE